MGNLGSCAWSSRCLQLFISTNHRTEESYQRHGAALYHTKADPETRVCTPSPSAPRPLSLGSALGSAFSEKKNYTKIRQSGLRFFFSSHQGAVGWATAKYLNRIFFEFPFLLNAFHSSGCLPGSFVRRTRTVRNVVKRNPNRTAGRHSRTLKGGKSMTTKATRQENMCAFLLFLETRCRTKREVRFTSLERQGNEEFSPDSVRIPRQRVGPEHAPQRVTRLKTLPKET